MGQRCQELHGHLRLAAYGVQESLTGYEQNVGGLQSLGRRRQAATREHDRLLNGTYDVLDLEELLKQTEGKGITIYTHGEMLLAHGHPRVKAYPHLYRNFATVWQNQKKELPDFPGAVLFTTAAVGWSGTTHVERKDFSEVIKRALALPGFAEDAPGKEVLAGFGRNAILSNAAKIVELVKAGKIKHFFLVGSIDGIPRLLDVGQCNDAYSAVQVAVALSEAFGVGVNDLPLSLILGGYEQKAMAVLLSLLHLGLKDIRLGPSFPALLSPNVGQYLVGNFAIKSITTRRKASMLCSGMIERLAVSSPPRYLFSPPPLHSPHGLLVSGGLTGSEPSPRMLQRSATASRYQGLERD